MRDYPGNENSIWDVATIMLAVATSILPVIHGFTCWHNVNAEQGFSVELYYKFLH